LRHGTTALVLPWHNPVLLAEQAATLDLLSGGRLDLRIGKGYRHNEFSGVRMAPEEAEQRFEEALTVMTQAWTSEEPFSHHGRYWRFENIAVEPLQSQRPHPPLWTAASKPESIRYELENSHKAQSLQSSGGKSDSCAAVERGTRRSDPGISPEGL
jgi:alkanesulfonate monooxygenase SsuD/methylene tetrahydromethanopterin reductase-like flavin-dependent oxidoreductase (luciferase family)